MGWLQYGLGLQLFNAIGLCASYLVQRVQAWLPLNPQRFGNVSPTRHSTPVAMWFGRFGVVVPVLAM